eukprot:SAG22_NODE_400_length_11089_cov_6.934668_1_plen_88_part_00
MRVPSTWFSLGVGFTGAILANAISSQSRLMGYTTHYGAENKETGLFEDGADEKVSCACLLLLGARADFVSVGGWVAAAPFTLRKALG